MFLLIHFYHCLMYVVFVRRIKVVDLWTNCCRSAEYFLKLLCNKKPTIKDAEMKRTWGSEKSGMNFCVPRLWGQFRSQQQIAGLNMFSKAHRHHLPSFKAFCLPWTKVLHLALVLDFRIQVKWQGDPACPLNKNIVISDVSSVFSSHCSFSSSMRGGFWHCRHGYTHQLHYCDTAQVASAVSPKPHLLSPWWPQRPVCCWHYDQRSGSLGGSWSSHVDHPSVGSVCVPAFPWSCPSLVVD